MCMFFILFPNFMQTNCKVIVFAPNSQIYFSYIAIFLLLLHSNLCSSCVTLKPICRVETESTVNYCKIIGH